MESTILLGNCGWVLGVQLMEIDSNGCFPGRLYNFGHFSLLMGEDSVNGWSTNIPAQHTPEKKKTSDQVLETHRLPLNPSF